MSENFEFNAGDTIGACGWTGFSSQLNLQKITSPGLSYAGYPYSGYGNAIKLDTTGQDSYKEFFPAYDSTATDAVYLSALINVSTAKPFGAYVLTLCDSGSTSFFRGRLYVKDSLGNVRFGLAKSAASDTSAMNIWCPTDFAYNTTYTVVIKYNFIVGAKDEVSLYVFSSGIPATEPVTPTFGPLTFASSDAGRIGRVILRQGESSRGPRCSIDGIRVSENWFSPYVNLKVAIQGLAGIGTTRIDTMQCFLRNSTSPYAIVDSRTQSYSFVSGTGVEACEFVNGTAGSSYYFEVRYRNAPGFKNGINTWSSAGGTTLVSGSNYDFTTAASQAFGSNQISVGGVFATYNGDVTQDATVDLSDITVCFNDAASFISGYLGTDLDGNDFVDLSDVVVAFNNSSNFIGEVAP